MVRINYELPDDVHQQAKIAAATAGTTLREFVIQALIAHAATIEKNTTQGGKK